MDAAFATDAILDVDLPASPEQSASPEGDRPDAGPPAQLGPGDATVLAWARAM